MDEQTKVFIETAQRATTARKSFNKVFCIGSHKTGTTSMQTVFHLCGLNVAPQHEGELHTEKAVVGEYSSLREYVKKYDAFQDSPFANGFVFSAMDALYPDSRFILTVRDEDDWFRSISTFHAKLMGLPSPDAITRSHIEKFNYLYPGYFEFVTRSIFLIQRPDFTALPGDRDHTVEWSKLYDKSWYIDSYRKRNEMIREYFRNQPDKLLEIDVTSEQTTEKVVRFLGLPEWMIVRMPALNRTE